MRTPLRGAQGQGARLQALRPLRPEPQRQRRRRPGNGGADTARRDRRRPTCSSARTRSRRPTRPTATTRSPSTPRSTRTGFTEVSNGYAGAASDGLTQLDARARAHRDLHRRAAPATSCRPRASTSAHDGTFTLALGFGATARRRGQRGRAARCRTPLSHGARSAYLLGWHRYDDAARSSRGARTASRRDALERAAATTYYLSANYVKAAEDKTFPGATAAALASPWGQAVSAGDPANTYFGSYREVFARDLYEAWTAALLAGDRARRARHDALPVRAPAARRTARCRATA